MNGSTEPSHVASKLSLISIALLGAILASCVLITGDSITVSSGETLPQVLLILLTVPVTVLAGWQVLPFRRPVALPAMLLMLAIVWLLVSTISATLRADGRAAWNCFWHVLALLMMSLVAAQVTRRPAMAQAILQMVLLCAVFQTTYAVHQYFVSMPAARAEYMANPDAAIAKAQIDAPPGSELRTQYENRLLGSFEPAGTFVLANSLAVLLSGAIVALGMMVLPWNMASANGAKSTAAGWAGWFLRVVLLLMICVWLLTKSRSGFLAVVLVVAVAFMGHRFRSNKLYGLSQVEKQAASGGGLRWAIITVVAILLIVATIGLLSSDRLVLSEAPKSVLYRLEYWQATSKMILDFPWTGVGLGNFQSYYPAYKLPAASEVIADPHNWLFDLAVNCSLPLLIVALLGLAWAWRCAKRNIEQANSNLTVQFDAADKMLISAFWIGGLLSLIMVGGLQLVLGELVDFDATMLSFLAALFVWFGLRALPSSERTVRSAALLAVATMLVSLLASGCWQASGMALPLAVLLAICCPSHQTILVLPWKELLAKSFMALATAVISLLCFVWQTWQPVQNSWALEQQAMSAWGHGQAESGISLVKQAIAADRLSSTSKRLLVQFTMEQALSAARRASAADFNANVAQVDTAIEELLAADSVSNLNHGYAGECNLALAAGCVSWNPQLALERVKAADEHYQQALRRYPTSVALHAQTALVQAWLDLRAEGGKLSESARRHLTEAFRLSDVTPHSNRKLAAQQVFLPPQLAEPIAAEAIVRANPGSPWAQAEPVCQFLRKL